MAAEARFVRIYADRWGLFMAGRCVADYRPSGRVYRVSLFWPNSTEPQRQVWVSRYWRTAGRVARQVCLELSKELEGSAD